MIETQYFVPLLDQTFTNVMDLSKICLSSSKFVEQSYQPEGQCTASWRCFDTAIGGLSNGVLGFKYL